MTLKILSPAALQSLLSYLSHYYSVTVNKYASLVKIHMLTYNLMDASV